tara:strand:+ start:2050 stop:2415 length:366 start_codon:yes stop_codon:yes gene_type:complete
MANNKKIFCFDLDNVICTTKKANYSRAKPKKNVVKTINDLYQNGHYIKIFTARYMGRNNENQKKAYKFGFNKTLKQLKKWNLKFHELILGKPTFDIYVDDKAYGYKKNWYRNFKKFIKNND